MTAVDGATGKTIRRTLTLRKDVPAVESDTRTQVSNAQTDLETSNGKRTKLLVSPVYRRKEQMGLPSPESIPAHRVEVYRLVLQREQEEVKPVADPQSVTNDIDDSIPVNRIPTQDRFLTALCRERIPAKFFLTNDVCIIGRIRSFDAFTILIESEETVLLYKRLIGAIVPRRAPSQRPISKWRR